MQSSSFNSAPLEIAVNIQDAFFENEPQSSPISLETWEQWFQGWIEARVADLPPAPSYELTLRLTNDAEIQSLNAQYRGKDQPTDVLAFAALEVDFPTAEELEFEPLYLGDLVISVETAKRQASEYNRTLRMELAWLAAHGFLHLLGWDHPEDDSLQRMLEEQERLLAIGACSE
ncbi:rRNA maturation RNase YbeY [Oscillatoria sp. FACHB-1406]|uniref:rRNA maturation RNase YbeY n=1 Tax=Oscillatoria sp. FACHB-1406 TaxID=2692846 RepID=UPI001683326F|nr:rRNA maturation RNase YbeY [Oscillatoria sp. FACHB-1406]MBD2577889.1 rRNA maturation RNase YbeY [Oscillatoria sp. FACHB-1406]